MFTLCSVLLRTGLVSFYGLVSNSGHQWQEVGCRREENEEQESQCWCLLTTTAHSPQFSRICWAKYRHGQAWWDDESTNPAAQQNFTDGTGQLLGLNEAICTVFIEHTGCTVHTARTGGRFRPVSHYQCKHSHCVRPELWLKSEDGSFWENSKFSTCRPSLDLCFRHNTAAVITAPESPKISNSVQ